MVPLLKEVSEGYTVDIELKGTHATTQALHLRLHFNIPGNVSDTDKDAFKTPWFFFLLYILSNTSSFDFTFECTGGDGNNIIVKCFFFWLWNRNQGNIGGCENVFFPSPQTAQGKALSSCILCSLFNSLPSLLTLNPLFLWLCVLTSLLFLLHLSTLWGSCVIKIYYGHSQWQNTTVVKPVIVLIFSIYIFENITQLRDMASMKVTYFP